MEFVYNWCKYMFEKIWMGIAFAAPIGPVTAEAIRRGLIGGFSPAFRIKMGAAIGDTLLLILAYVGLKMIEQYVFASSVVELIGACLIIYLGIRNIQKARRNTEIDIGEDEIIFKNGMLVGFGLAVTNPLALSFWISALTGPSNGVASSSGFLDCVFIIVGVLIWDVIFCTLLEGGKKFVNKNSIRNITIIAGTSLCGLGTYKLINPITKISKLLAIAT